MYSNDSFKFYANYFNIYELLSIPRINQIAEKDDLWLNISRNRSISKMISPPFFWISQEILWA